VTIALRARRVHALHQSAPALRIGHAIGQQEPHRPTGLVGQPRHPCQLFRLVIEIAVHAERAIAEALQRRADPHQLIHFGVAAGHHVPAQGLVRIGARGGEAECARLHCLES
jgi:hypothetical protein